MKLFRCIGCSTLMRKKSRYSSRDLFVIYYGNDSIVNVVSSNHRVRDVAKLAIFMNRKSQYSTRIDNNKAIRVF